MLHKFYPSGLRPSPEGGCPFHGELDVGGLPENYKVKAELLADTFQNQWALPLAQDNEYSQLVYAPDAPDNLVPIRTRHARQFLEALSTIPRHTRVLIIEV